MNNPHYTKADDFWMDQHLRAAEAECCAEAGVELSGMSAAERLADAIMREYEAEDERTARIEEENAVLLAERTELQRRLCVAQSLACLGWIAACVAAAWAMQLWWFGVTR